MSNLVELTSISLVGNASTPNVMTDDLVYTSPQPQGVPSSTSAVFDQGANSVTCNLDSNGPDSNQTLSFSGGVTFGSSGLSLLVFYKYRQRQHLANQKIELSNQRVDVLLSEQEVKTKDAALRG